MKNPQHVPAFDAITETTSGWLNGTEERLYNIRADDRFSKKDED